MKKLKHLFIVFCLTTLTLQLETRNCYAQGANTTPAVTKEMSFTLDDHDRLIRMEEKASALEKRMDTRFEATNTLIYFILGGVFGLIGLIMWDRLLHQTRERGYFCLAKCTKGVRQRPAEISRHSPLTRTDVIKLKKHYL